MTITHEYNSDTIDSFTFPYFNKITPLILAFFIYNQLSDNI